MGNRREFGAPVQVHTPTTIGKSQKSKASGKPSLPSGGSKVVGGQVGSGCGSKSPPSSPLKQPPAPELPPVSEISPEDLKAIARRKEEERIIKNDQDSAEMPWTGMDETGQPLLKRILQVALHDLTPRKPMTKVIDFLMRKE